MFGPVTTRLIATAPPLDGVDLEDLPKQFTRAFADIVAARVRLREKGGCGSAYPFSGHWRGPGCGCGICRRKKASASRRELKAPALGLSSRKGQWGAPD